MSDFGSSVRNLELTREDVIKRMLSEITNGNFVTNYRNWVEMLKCLLNWEAISEKAHELAAQFCGEGGNFIREFWSQLSSHPDWLRELSLGPAHFTEEDEPYEPFVRCLHGERIGCFRRQPATP